MQKPRRCVQCKVDLPDERRDEWEQYRIGSNMYFCCEACKRMKVQDMQAKQAEAFEIRRKKKQAREEQAMMYEREDLETMEAEAKKQLNAGVEQTIREQSETIDNLTERLAKAEKKSKMLMGMLRMMLDEVEEA